MARHLNETGLAGGLPEGIREVILRRVSRLSEPCVRALTLAAVVGREFDLDVLEAFADLSENDLLDAIDEARQAQLIDEAAGKPGRYSFHHALIRDALYDGMASTRRVRIHRRVAEALERLSAHRRRTAARRPRLPLHAGGKRRRGRARQPTTPSAPPIAWPRRSLTKKPRASTTTRCRRSTHMPAGPDIERQRVAIHRRRGRAFGNLGAMGQPACGTRPGTQTSAAGPEGRALRDPHRHRPGPLLAVRHPGAGAGLGRSADARRWARPDRLGGHQHGLAGALSSGRRQRDRGHRERPRNHRPLRRIGPHLALPWVARALLGGAWPPGRRAGRQRDGDGRRRCTMRRSRCTRCRTPRWRLRPSVAMPMRLGFSARRARSAASTA